VTIIMMGLTGSITDGIGFGFIVYAFGSAVSGKAHDVSVTMWVVVALFMAYFALINLVN
jgi:AGZA family xanthine/uracil permease-like MFS transporter